MLIPVAATVALYLGSAAGAPAAWAHVHASSDNPVRGAMSIVTFQVPNDPTPARQPPRWPSHFPMWNRLPMWHRPASKACRGGRPSSIATRPPAPSAR